MMRKLLGVLIVAVSFTGMARASGDPMVDIFSNFTQSGGGAPFSGFVGSFSSPDIQFATNTGYGWHPFGLSSFGADITSSLFVTSTGSYTFSLNSDDGSQLFIDGSLVVDDGGTHGPTIATGTATLSAGKHSLEVQFYECCGGPSGVDLNLAPGTSFTPEPSSLLLLLTGVGAVPFRRLLSGLRRG